MFSHWTKFYKLWFLLFKVHQNIYSVEAVSWWWWAADGGVQEAGADAAEEEHTRITIKQKVWPLTSGGWRPEQQNWSISILFLLLLLLFNHLAFTLFVLLSPRPWSIRRCVCVCLMSFLTLSDRWFIKPILNRVTAKQSQRWVGAPPHAYIPSNQGFLYRHLRVQTSRPRWPRWSWWDTQCSSSPHLGRITVMLSFPSS